MFRPLAILAGFLTLLLTAASAAPEYPGMGKDIFDAKADGNALIANAVARAKQEDKNIVVFIGANWCPWCRRLHKAFAREDVIKTLERKSVLIYLDGNMRNDKNRNADLLQKYGDPIPDFGLPVLVVLDRDGNPMTTRETASLAANTDEEVAARVLALVKRIGQMGCCAVKK